MEKTGIVILAAGGSSRMGKPKLAEKINKVSILEQSILEISKIESSCKVVVLGANQDIYRELISYPQFDIVVNERWREGIATSIKAGVNYVLVKCGEEIEKLLIILADMPFVKAQILYSLEKAAKETGKGIIASDYGSSIGPPALFSKTYLAELLAVDGDKGAKSVILNHPDDLELIDFPQGIFDIDTPEDLEEMRRRI